MSRVKDASLLLMDLLSCPCLDRKAHIPSSSKDVSLKKKQSSLGIVQVRYRSRLAHRRLGAGGGGFQEVAGGKVGDSVLSRGVESTRSGSLEIDGSDADAVEGGQAVRPGGDGAGRRQADLQRRPGLAGRHGDAEHGTAEAGTAHVQTTAWVWLVVEPERAVGGGGRDTAAEPDLRSRHRLAVRPHHAATDLRLLREAYVQPVLPSIGGEGHLDSAEIWPATSAPRSRVMAGTSSVWPAAAWTACGGPPGTNPKAETPTR
jgi:hypothetical protein